LIIIGLNGQACQQELGRCRLKRGKRKRRDEKRKRYQFFFLEAFFLFFGRKEED
jgi:hypothetical protein